MCIHDVAACVNEDGGHSDQQDPSMDPCLISERDVCMLVLPDSSTHGRLALVSHIRPPTQRRPKLAPVRHV